MRTKSGSVHLHTENWKQGKLCAQLCPQLNKLWLPGVESSSCREMMQHRIHPGHQNMSIYKCKCWHFSFKFKLKQSVTHQSRFFTSTCFTFRLIQVSCVFLFPVFTSRGINLIKLSVRLEAFPRMLNYPIKRRSAVIRRTCTQSAGDSFCSTEEETTWR